MAAKALISFPFLAVYSLLSISGVFSTTFTFLNQCSYTVWPGILSGAGTSPLSITGFTLNPGESVPLIPIPAGWSGRLWGRTLCTIDAATSRFTCLTGDCGSGTVDCAGAGVAPPATLAEFTLNGANGLDFFDVSLVDGYNLPILVVPQGGTGAGNCMPTGCATDLNGACPSDLKVNSTAADLNGGAGVGGSVACKSACDAFGDPQYCCNGAYSMPDTCKPTYYSQFFKSACPRAYSYAYDDGSSTFTCQSADYLITFCPTPAASQKSLGGPPTTSGIGGDSSLVTSGTQWNNIPLHPFTIFIILFATLYLSFALTGHAAPL